MARKFIVFMFLAAVCALVVSCDWFDGDDGPPDGSGPSAPTGLTAEAASATRVDLHWTDTSGNETGFRVERKTGSLAFQQIAQTAADQTTYADTSVAEETTYTYRVRAYNDDGSSDYTPEANVTTPPAGGGGGAAERSRGDAPLWFAYADADGNLWYVPDDPQSQVQMARVAITDAGGTQQTGSSVSVDYDSDTGMLWFAYVDLDGNLWYVPDDPDTAVNMARSAITDAGGTQQTGSSVSVDYDPGEGLLWFAFVDDIGGLWFVPDDPDMVVDMAKQAVTDAGGTQQMGTAVSIKF